MGDDSDRDGNGDDDENGEKKVTVRVVEEGQNPRRDQWRRTNTGLLALISARELLWRKLRTISVRRPVQDHIHTINLTF